MSAKDSTNDPAKKAGTDYNNAHEREQWEKWNSVGRLAVRTDPRGPCGAKIRFVRLLDELGNAYYLYHDYRNIGWQDISVKFVLSEIVKDPEALRKCTADNTAWPEVRELFYHEYAYLTDNEQEAQE